MFTRIAIVLLFLLFFCPPRVYADVVLNEIFPKTEDPANQWIELYNTGTDTVSLNLWGISHTAGDKKEFTLNASFNIPGNGFLLLSQTQTGITLSLEGDTVRLINAGGTIVDSVSYPGTLGYATALGRSIDGTGGWGVCLPPPSYGSTGGAANKCQAPSPTPTRLPTPTNTPGPTNTPTPTILVMPSATPSATVTPTTAVLGDQSFGSLMQTTDAPPAAPTLVEENMPVATPTAIAFIQSRAYRFVWVAGIGIGILLAVGVVIAGKHHKKKKIVLHI